MYCPVCNHEDTKVVDSRVTQEGLIIRRRRECLKCNYRFSTYEQVEMLDLVIVKRDGGREAYLKDKLEAGLKRALEKRAYTREDFQKLVNRIERDIQKLKKTEITSDQIGEIIMKSLKKFDKVAYIRFASVYRSFEDVETFKAALAELSKSKQKPKQKLKK